MIHWRTDQLMVTEVSEHETAQATTPGAQAEGIDAEVLIARLGLAAAGHPGAIEAAQA